MQKVRVLVFGARAGGSLGSEIAGCAAVSGYEVATAGIHEENYSPCDATSVHQVRNAIELCRPHHVICTVGRNLPGTIEGKGWYTAMKEQAEVNYFGPMIVLSEWARFWRGKFKEAGQARMAEEWGDMTLHCVAISSNSADIARSSSGGYCASKAALTMGYRCAAREQAGHPFAIYTYEPGWLTDTPMSDEVQARLMEGLPAHRIPAGMAGEVDPAELAMLIVDNLSKGRWLNGSVLRMDGGEQ